MGARAACERCVRSVELTCWLACSALKWSFGTNVRKSSLRFGYQMQVCVDLGAGVDRTLCDRFDVSMAQFIPDAKGETFMQWQYGGSLHATLRLAFQGACPHRVVCHGREYLHRQLSARLECGHPPVFVA